MDYILDNCNDCIYGVNIIIDQIKWGNNDKTCCWNVKWLYIFEELIKLNLRVSQIVLKLKTMLQSNNSESRNSNRYSSKTIEQITDLYIIANTQKCIINYTVFRLESQFTVSFSIDGIRRSIILSMSRIKTTTINILKGSNYDTINISLSVENSLCVIPNTIARDKSIIMLPQESSSTASETQLERSKSACILLESLYFINSSFIQHANSTDLVYIKTDILFKVNLAVRNYLYINDLIIFKLIHVSVIILVDTPLEPTAGVYITIIKGNYYENIVTTIISNIHKPGNATTINQTEKVVIYLRIILSASNADNTISKSDIVLEYFIINTIASITSRGGTFDMTNEHIILSSVRYKSINKFLCNMSESLKLVNNHDKVMKKHKTAIKKAKMVVIGAMNWYYGIDYAAVIFNHVIQQILMILIQIKFEFYHTKFLWIISTSTRIAMMIIIKYIIIKFFSYFIVISQISASVTRIIAIIAVIIDISDNSVIYCQPAKATTTMC